MQFGKDNTFRVVQFSDLWADGDSQHFIDTTDFVEKLLKKEKPNLVVITGDTVDPSSKTYQGHWESIMQKIKDANVPYVSTGGSLLNGTKRSDALDIDRNFGGDLSWSGFKWNLDKTTVKGTEQDLGYYTSRIPIMDSAGTSELMSIYTLDTTSFATCNESVPGSTCSSV